MSRSSVLTENFIGRLDPKPTKTSRYLWHITYRHFERDAQIAAEGLLRPANYAVFAHSSVFSFDNMYPYFMDMWEFSIQGVEYFDHFSAYSFWRIDTQLANVDWFVDPNMEKDSNIAGLKPRNYVCSLNNIPSHALKLFNYDRERFINKTPFIDRMDGVASIRPIKSDFDTLVPNHEINNYMLWRENKLAHCK